MTDYPKNIRQNPPDGRVHDGFLKPKPRYRAAIIGLGQIGNQFDNDPKRSEIWTHAGAYQALPEVSLIAGADPDGGRRSYYSEQRQVAQVYADYREMLVSEDIDILSICSPTHLHYEMVLEGVRSGVKAIFCEKPIASTVAEAMTMVEACQSEGVLLAVNHSRRWERVYMQARQWIQQGEIGRIESMVGYYPGKVFTMGTHLFDLMRYFGGDVAWVSGAVDRWGGEEWNLSGQIHFQSGVVGSVVAGRDRVNHIFELDLLGSQGRLRFSEDGIRREYWRYEESTRYSGYRELSPVDTETFQRISGPHALGIENRLVGAVQDIVNGLSSGTSPACTGNDGRAALEIAWALCESAMHGNARVNLPFDECSTADASVTEALHRKGVPL